MIFQHTWEKVLSGEKTQTRRLVRPGQRLQEVFYDWQQMYVYADETNKRCVYGTYHDVLYPKTYAVQPGRGQKAVARIRILSIKREDVRVISDEDVEAEGFKSISDFCITWVKMHDKSVTVPIIPDYNTNEIIWHGVRNYLLSRPAEYYDAWVLTFEVVK